MWIILILLATPLWMRLAWEIGSKKALNLLIVDKTVLNSNSYKHRSVNWILDYEKYTKSSGELPLIDMYHKEDVDTRTEILRTLEVVGSERSIPFLEKILKQPLEDYPLEIQAVRSLLAMGTTGNSIVDKIYQQSGAQMQLVINHARDKRL